MLSTRKRWPARGRCALSSMSSQVKFILPKIQRAQGQSRASSGGADWHVIPQTKVQLGRGAHNSISLWLRSCQLWRRLIPPHLETISRTSPVGPTSVIRNVVCRWCQCATAIPKLWLFVYPCRCCCWRWLELPRGRFGRRWRARRLVEERR